MADKPNEIVVCDGKYTLIMDPCNMRALRYGEPWRDLVGDGFVMALGQEIERQQDRLAKAEALIADMAEHDGAEGFSESTYKLMAEWNAE